MTETVLGVDYGRSRIGLAVAYKGVNVVLPHGALAAANLGELQNIIVAKKIKTVIFGWPLSLNGAENENTARIKNFADELKTHLPDLKIEFEDERFSSQAAVRSVDSAVSVDERSAMIILESWLSRFV